MARQDRKVIKYRKRININIGFVVFSVILIYLTAYIIMYFARDKITIYEVITGKNATSSNKTYKALILRDEQVVNTTSSGYLNYYLREGDRASVNSSVYSIDESGTVNKLLESANEDGEKLIQEDDEVAIRDLLSNLTIEENNYDFSYIYNYKMDIEALVLQSINLSNINTIISSNTSNVPFIINKAIRTGIVAYYTDGYEQKQESSLIKSDFSTENYKKTSYSSGDLIETGSPVYKSINSENWTLYYELSSEEEALYKEDTRMKIKVVKDNNTLVGDFSIIYINSIPYAKLILNQYMKEYVSERFLEIKIIGKETTGLKIPKTSILKKDFFLIPKEFRENGANSKDLGFYKEVFDEDKNTYTIEFISPDIYSANDLHYFVSTSKDFKAGDRL